LGYGLWTLTEYWLHRIVFHFEPEDGFGAKLHWLIHGVHHEHPNDPNRLVMPPSASIPLAAIFLIGYRVVFGAPAWLAVSAGFLVGYVVYDTMHWYLHHRIPRSRIGRRLRELHLRHHFQDDTRGFGISAPYWDRVFHTAPVSRRQAIGRREADG
jgi:dihydroceramide fatty acyl 2-hydroxylase